MKYSLQISDLRESQRLKEEFIAWAQHKNETNQIIWVAIAGRVIDVKKIFEGIDSVFYADSRTVNGEYFDKEVTEQVTGTFQVALRYPLVLSVKFQYRI